MSHKPNGVLWKTLWLRCSPSPVEMSATVVTLRYSLHRFREHSSAIVAFAAMKPSIRRASPLRLGCNVDPGSLNVIRYFLQNSSV